MISKKLLAKIMRHFNKMREPTLVWREPKHDDVCEFFSAAEIDGETVRWGFAKNGKGDFVGLCFQSPNKKIEIVTVESLFAYAQVYGTPAAPADELERQMIFRDLT